VKSEPKAFASLSSGLLARKGAARPAMKPQGFGQMGGGNLEDLGWNDMGFEAPRPAIAAVRDAEHDAFGEEIPDRPVRSPLAGLTPVQSPVHGQQAEIADRFAPEAENDQDDSFEAESFEAEAVELEAVEVEALEVEAFVAPAELPAEAPVQQVVVPAPAVAPLPRRRAPKLRSAVGAKGKAAFTLRLDPQRHLKLRLACAVDGRSAQMLVTDALDQLLAAMPELDAMAAKANRKG
jgi:hypothetical protein